MKIAQLNDFRGSSTGNIMNSIAQYGWIQGEEIYTFCPPLSQADETADFPGHFYVGTYDEKAEHLQRAEVTGMNGFYSENATKELIQKLDELDVELVHLHNLHAFSWNLPILFEYIEKKNLPVVWTLHGCWPFTGKCVHFTLVGCDKWKTDCYDCPQLHVWPWSKKIDNSAYMYKWKKEHFCRIENMTVVTPSEWLGNLAKQSFLGKYPVKVINNGINTYRFRPEESDFRKKYQLEDKVILLAVAWGRAYEKGIDVLFKLGECLEEKYQVVVVGFLENQKPEKLSNVLVLPRTASTHELATLYTAADFFINTTRQENFPTVNMEALACGTPVITFDTGGSPEIIDETCGRVVPCDDIEALIRVIEEATLNRTMTKENCLKRAQNYREEMMCEAYLDLYRQMVLKNR